MKDLVKIPVRCCLGHNTRWCQNVAFRSVTCTESMARIWFVSLIAFALEARGERRLATLTIIPRDPLEEFILPTLRPYALLD